MKEKSEWLEYLKTLSDEDLQLLEIESYKDDLFAFASTCLGYKDLTWNTHGPICLALQENTKRKLICVPRGCFKSTIASIAYPLWILLRDPSARIMIDSEIYTNSKNFLREIKGHLQSQRFIDLFGDWGGEVWQEGEITLKHRKKILKEPSISCAGVETTKVGMHFDYIIHDDLCSDSNMMTEEGRQKVIRHYQMNTSILEPNGTIVVIGTRYHADDIIGHIQKNEIL